MKRSIDNLTFTIPGLIAADAPVNVWFSLKNGHASSPNASVDGFNLGYNTPEDQEVITQNRRRLVRALGLEPEWVAWAGQVHGNRVIEVMEGGTYPETDALVTQVPGLALAIQVADCAAVLLWDAENRIIAAVHAGWRGAAGDILTRAIETMKRRGAVAEKTKAYVSPCLSLKNFEVGPEVAEQFPDEYVEYTGYEKPHLDLKGYLRSRMLEAGLRSENMEIDRDCTIDHQEKYYSYRREGDQSGRMAGIIQLK